jgi:hypothetical protein
MSAAAQSQIETVFDLALPGRPYPGLRAFNKEEWPIFFGRERMTDDVIQRLIDQQFLVVHGDSGCGKSSLIRAGVLPRLEQEAARGGVRWLTCMAMPGDEPLKNLSRALASVGGAEKVEERAMELRRIMHCGRDGAVLLAEQLAAAKGHVCILFDQFEELFAHSRRKGRHEASVLIDLLIGLHQLQAPHLCVVLTMRSEFLGMCAQFEDFAETVNATQYLLPRMAQSDLVRAICEPALLYDGEVSLALAQRLIADAGGQQDQLPLIQHGLMMLHREHVREGAGWRLTSEHYTGGRDLAALLSKHADEIADRVAPEPSRAVEDLFRALTDINADGTAVRRPLKFGQLIAITGTEEPELRRVLDAFRAEGVSFVRPYGTEPLISDDYVDISHEALIRYWGRLADPAKGWLINEFKNGLVWRSLLVQADSFEREASNVLSSATTEEREIWMRRRNPTWSERYGGGWERVKRLMAASVSERERQLRAKEEERQREADARIREHELAEKTRREHFFKRALAVVIVMTIVAITGAVVAYRQTVENKQARRTAEIEREAAVTARRSAEADRQAAEVERDTVARAKLAADKFASDLMQEVERLRKTAAASKDENVKQQIAQTGALLQRTINQLQTAAWMPPRIYIHIADESQRQAASLLERQLERQNIGDVDIMVPGIQLVRQAPSANQLRCFGTNECSADGSRLVSLINQSLEIPVKLAEFPPPKDPSSIRARHFELWFAQGPIEVRGAGEE